MSETEAIQKMSEFLSDKILNVFKWKKTGPVNQNWVCVHGKKHNGRDTHPSDVVFYYDEPYKSIRTYINIDLKSYAKGSIQTSAINKAMYNLCESVECANSSANWQELYTHSGRNFRVYGLLFVYNHDGVYDSDFLNLLTRCEVSNENSLPEDSVLGVWSPEKICYLNTVANNIKTTLFDMRCHEYEFFYPDLEQRVTVQSNEWESAATFEMLLSSMIMVKYKDINDSNHDYGIIIYYSRKGESRQEFKYLIEYLFHYQVLQHASKIEIRLANAHECAVSQLEKAKEEIIESAGTDAEDLAKRLTKISASTIQDVLPAFSEIEIGMRYE